MKSRGRFKESVIHTTQPSSNKFLFCSQTFSPNVQHSDIVSRRPKSRCSVQASTIQAFFLSVPIQATKTPTGLGILSRSSPSRQPSSKRFSIQASTLSLLLVHVSPHSPTLLSTILRHFLSPTRWLVQLKAILTLLISTHPFRFDEAHLRKFPQPTLLKNQKFQKTIPTNQLKN